MTDSTQPPVPPTGPPTVPPMPAGVMPMGASLDGTVWNILGQRYVPKQRCASSMSWHASFPVGTFVPPHIHPTQDEFLYILEGRFDLWLDGAETSATPGDLVHLPRGIPHGIFNRTDQTAKALFWVSPTGALYDLFWALHALGPTPNPADVVAVAARHEVDFLPPPPDGAQGGAA